MGWSKLTPRNTWGWSEFWSAFVHRMVSMPPICIASHISRCVNGEELVGGKADLWDECSYPGKKVTPWIKIPTYNMGNRVHILISRCDVRFHLVRLQALSQLLAHTDKIENWNGVGRGGWSLSSESKIWMRVVLYVYTHIKHFCIYMRFVQKWSRHSKFTNKWTT